MGKFTIEPVKGRKQRHAVRFLIGGSRRDELVEAQAQALERQTMVGRSPAAHLWWARSWRQCHAAAMVFENIGRTGILFASPADAPGVDLDALIELLREITSFVLGRGLSLVQSLLAPESYADKDVLLRAGFRRLAMLTYMSWDLARFMENRGLTPISACPYGSAKSVSVPDFPGLEMRMADLCGEAALAEVIEASYRQSLDCPGLEGLRRIGDVIAGHKACGVYRPESWWIAMRDGRPAGCLLLNDSALGVSADVIYLGVTPEFRGRGLGRAMLEYAARYARRRGIGQITLAVDEDNRYAVTLYRSLGFTSLHSREAFIVTE